VTLLKLTGRSTARALMTSAVTVAVVLAVGLTATPASADETQLMFSDCLAEAPGELTAITPTGPQTLSVAGRLDRCSNDFPQLRLGVAAYFATGRKTVALPSFGAAPTYRFAQSDIRLPVGKVKLCLLRTPFGAEECYDLSVEDGSQQPVVLGRTSTTDSALRERPKPDSQSNPFCATCW
jgi:hypothetical protein